MQNKKLHATVLFPSVSAREKALFKSYFVHPGSRRHLYINSTPLGFALSHLESSRIVCSVELKIITCAYVKGYR